VDASLTLNNLAGRLACPQCGGPLAPEFSCKACASSYQPNGGVLDLRPPEIRGRAEERDWSKHWSDEFQKSNSQRFFSFYRKAVFARTVRHFLDGYFPQEGVFVEAGAGTSETSMLVSKHDGKRTLVALDLIREVLALSHPVMDVRVAGDIFRLPFQTNSLDGIWNVGVMEHFTHDRIDAILREFHRVLRPGGRVILLWPAVFSIPQRMLRILEYFINLRRSQDDIFRFHPDEITQIRSIQEGREVLGRNGFSTVMIDPGLYSLMAFETLVGEKPGPAQ